MFKLVIQDDEGKTTVVPLIRDEITIGRKEGNTIRLTERNVSRKHAKISRANGAVAIEDLGSYNGVKVNGTRILQKVTLSISDRVQIGDYLIELKAEGAEQQTPASYEDARTQPIERLDAATLGALGLSPPPQPAQPMGLADTDPTRRGVTAAAAPAAAAAAPARLVVLSSNFAGREFALTKTPMVIGRTDDNDIVINHRSISRNHAQVIRDGNRFTIADMQSANGVRVNGEDYSNVELRRGDTVDLGHVRMRFVEPGEDFLFGRDAQVVDVPVAGKKTWLWALLGGGVIAAVVVVILASGGSKGKAKGETVAAGPGPSVAGGGTGTVTPPPGPGTALAVGPDTTGPGSMEVTPPGPGSETGTGAGSTMVTPPGPGSATGTVDNAALAAALADARAAVEASDWDKASEKAQAALKIDPVNTDARALADQAQRESTNDKYFKAFNDAAAAKEYDKAVKAFEKISTDSVYKNQARGTFDDLHDKFIAERVKTGKLMASQKKCTDLKRLAIYSGNIFPDAKAELDRIPCDDGGSRVVTGPGTGGGSATPPGPGTGGGSATPPAGGQTATQLLADANSAAASSQWGRALTLAEQAMKAPGIDAPNKSKAVTIAGLAACNTKNTAKAKTYYGMSPPARQTLLRQACLKQGIELL